MFLSYNGVHRTHLLLEEVVKLSTNKLGPTHEETMRWMNHLTTTYRRNGNHDKPIMKKLFGFKR